VYRSTSVGTATAAWGHGPLCDQRVPNPPSGTGFLGAYTTFSTFRYETIMQSKKEQAGLAFPYRLPSLASGHCAGAAELGVEALCEGFPTGFPWGGPRPCTRSGGAAVVNLTAGFWRRLLKEKKLRGRAG
jgi:hypothetical protein